MHLREHHEEGHIIATRCVYFSGLFLNFLCVDMTATTPGQSSFEPRLSWKMKRECVFFWPSAAPPAGPPHEPGGGYWPSYAQRYSLRSVSIVLLQSSILIDFYHSIIDTD